MEINQETRDALRGIAEKFATVFAEIVKGIQKWIQENWKQLKEVAVKWYQLEEEKKVIVHRRHKRDFFSRQKISHQVINRKPKHMVRKIIR